MDIKKRLKLYKENKAKLESTESRINWYKELLNMDDEYIERLHVHSNLDNLGIRGTNGKYSTVERIFEEQMFNRESIKTLIQEEKSRMFFIKLELEQIECAVKSLTMQEQFIYNCKMNEDITSPQLLNMLKEKFDKQLDSTSSIDKIYWKILDKVVVFLEDFYTKYQTVYFNE